MQIGVGVCEICCISSQRPLALRPLALRPPSSISNFNFNRSWMKITLVSESELVYGKDRQSGKTMIWISENFKGVFLK